MKRLRIAAVMLGACTGAPSTPTGTTVVVGELPSASSAPPTSHPTAWKPASWGAAAAGPEKDHLTAEARPLAWRVHDGDALELAVHLQRTDPASETRGLGDYKAALRSVHIEVEDQKGVRQERSVAFPKKEPPPYWFWPSATLFLDIGPAALTPKQPHAPAAPYAEGAFAPWTGELRVIVRGEIGLEDGSTRRFETGAAAFDVRPEHPEREKLTALAGGLASKEGTLGPDVEAGFVEGVVLQKDEHTFLARYAAPKGFAFELITVVLDTSAAEPAATVEKQQVFTCVARGMHVDTPSGPRLVEELAVGDAVWGYAEGEGRVVTAVKAVQSYSVERTIWIDERLHLAPYHPVWIDGTWRAAAEVHRGQSLFTVDGRVPVRSVREAGADIVYALDVDEPDDFFVEGVLVHNKDRGYEAALDDPWLFMWSPHAR